MYDKRAHLIDLWAIWKSVLSILALGFIFHVNSAEANIRAPQILPWMPSSVLEAPPSHIHIKVLHEDLRFVCRVDKCQVAATYQVETDAPVHVRLRFILPVNKDVTARVGTNPESVQIVPAQHIVPDLNQRGVLTYPEVLRPPLFQATVELTLQTGKNDLTFQYDQPLGAEEQDYGYTSKGRMLYQFTYVLWPLQEWKRAADFRIDLSVLIDRQQPSFWQRWFGKYKDIGCETTTGRSLGKLFARRTQQDHHFIYETQILGAIPDTLICYLGDDDLIKPYR